MAQTGTNDTDPAATAAAALTLELPECGACAGDTDSIRYCQWCKGTGRQGGAIAAALLDGMKDELTARWEDYSIATVGCALGNINEHNKALTDAKVAIRRIAVVIRKVCGEGE